MTARMQINLWFVGATDWPFINCAKLIPAPWRADGASEDQYELYDSNGYPTRMATGVSLYREFLTIYLTDKDPWVIDWEGEAKIALSSLDAAVVAGVNVLSSNRVEVTFTSESKALLSSFLAQIIITATAEGNHGRNIRVYRKSHERLLNSGQVCSPHFLDRYRGWGRIRFMDYQLTNQNPQIKWAHRALTTDHSWHGATLRKAFYCGEATQTANDFTTASALSDNPASWTHGQQVSCRMGSTVNTTVIATFSKAKPAAIEATSHGLTTGDLVCFTGLSGDFAKYTARQWFPVTVTSPNSVTINGLNSSGWNSSYSSGGQIVKQVRVKAGNLPFKRVEPAFSYDKWALGDVRVFTYDAVRDRLMQTLGPMSFGVGATNTERSRQIGAPLEVLVSMTNELHVNPWFCIPHGADSEWVENFAALLRDTIDPALKICLEFSNEIWNTGAGFGQTGYALSQARALWPTAIDQNEFDFTGVHNWYGMRFHEVMTIVDRVFAGQEHRIEKVFSMWTAGTADSSHVTPRLVAPLANLPSRPASLATSIAIAPYCEPRRSTTADARQVWKFKQGGNSAREALDWLDAKWRAIDGTAWSLQYLRDTLFPIWKGIADDYGLRLTQYEGGWGGIPSLNALTANTWDGDSLTSTDRDNLFFGYAGSEQYARVARLNLQNFLRAGGEYPSQYCLVAAWGSGGMWGCIHDSIFGTQTPTYREVWSFNKDDNPYRFTCKWAD